MRLSRQVLLRSGIPAERIRVSLERNMQCGVGLCGHCQLGPLLVCRDGPVVDYARGRSRCSMRSGSCDDRTSTLPHGLAVWKFASCDGCQLTLLDCEDELLALAGEVQIAHFLEASQRRCCPGRTTCRWSRGRSPQPTDVERIRRIREQSGCWSPSAPAPPPAASRRCATSPMSTEFRAVVYAQPEYIDTLATSTPIAAHVRVDFELRGCPIDRRQLLELLTALLAGRKPDIPDTACAPSASAAG